MIYGFYIFDIAAGILLLIGIFAGMRKGLVKMLFGLISSLAALACAVMLVMPVTTFIVESTPADDYLVYALKAPIAAQFPVLDTPVVYYDHDGDPNTEEILGFYYNETITPVKEVFEQSEMLNMFATQLEDALIKIIPPDGFPSALFAISSIIVRYLLIPIDFILIWILASIILSIVKKILSGMIKRIASLHFLDKLAGIAISIVYVAAILLAFITFLELTASNEMATEIKLNYVDNSTIGGFLNSVNPFPALFEKLDFSGWIEGITKNIGIGE